MRTVMVVGWTLYSLYWRYTERQRNGWPLRRVHCRSHWPCRTQRLRTLWRAGLASRVGWGEVIMHVAFYGWFLGQPYTRSGQNIRQRVSPLYRKIKITPVLPDRLKA